MEKCDDNTEGRGIVRLYCRNCKRPLLELQLLQGGDDESQVLTRIAVKCDICDEFSRVEQVVGRFSPGAISDQMCFDILDNDVNAPEVDVLFKVWKK